jgi:hypothetical protein
MGDKSGAYRNFVGKSGGKKQLWGSKRKWEDNIRMELNKKGCESVDCIDLAQDKDKWLAFVNAAMKVQFPKMQGISCLAEKPLGFEENSVPWS